MSLHLKDSSLLRQQAFINGAWVDADSGSTIAVFNPANGEHLGTVPRMGPVETARAIDAAHAAFARWSKTTAKERAAVLRKWYDLILAHAEDLAQILTAEHGKPLAEARVEVVANAAYFEWFAEQAKRVNGAIIPSHMPDRRLLVLHQPVGVAAAITPWNFPSGMIPRKIGPALAAGCTVVLKPASKTPLSAYALMELGVRAGVPAGVVNVLSGNAADVGREICHNPKVAKITFTGSTEVGRWLIRESADQVKKLSMELGGNAPFIVFDDADIDAAVEGAMLSKYRGSGQTCVCANRIYIQDGLYERFAEKFVAKVRQLTVGNGAADGVTQGPLIDMAAVEKIESHIADALKNGGRLLSGGKRHALGFSFFEPTVIADVQPGALVTREETFAPLAPLIRFKDEAEVLAMANDTEFGLASYCYTKDLARAWRVAEALESGMVAINTGVLATEVAPFGGMKQSGIGREGSTHGIEHYMEIKYVSMAGL